MIISKLINMKLSNKYHKIMSIYKRSDITKKFLIGEYATPEIEYLKDNTWVFTEKVDGTNIRIMWNGKDVIYGGRSDDAQLPVPLIYKLDEMFKVFKKRQIFKEVFGEEEQDTVLYGEGYGNKIQKAGNFYLPNAVSFVLFDVKVGEFYLERENIEDIGHKFDIKVVPIVGQGTLNDAIEMTKKGFNSKWGNFIAEGIVARPKVEMFTRKGERVITKVKHRDFRI